MAAESLNNKAAKKILNIRNSKNDVWKLDLHGLHASEAIQALREHLQQIETKVLSNHSVSPNKVRMEKRIISSSSLESFYCMDTEKLDQQKAPSTQRPTSLQVITGILFNLTLFIVLYDIINKIAKHLKVYVCCFLYA